MDVVSYNPEKNNFGDELTKDLILKISPDFNFIGTTKRSNDKSILTLGSIFHEARKGDVIWGTGINPYWQKNIPENLDIRAVRGPLTRKYILENSNNNCPEVYGDPALLLPIFFPEFKNLEKKYEITIIPHYSDLNHPEIKSLSAVISPELPWKKVVGIIAQSNFVISSSLHGLIVADAYGISSRWWNSKGTEREKTEGTFKYNDYYLSTGRPKDCFGMTISECKKMGGVPNINSFDIKKLLDSFPKEII